jgi:hypothetical protein
MVRALNLSYIIRDFDVEVSQSRKIYFANISKFYRTSLKVFYVE